MKLIIDIEKDYYEILKYNVEHEQNYKPWNIIANGIPYEERPQGEWNYIQAGMCVCQFCGAMPHKEYKNFCANCGAQMVGGGENVKT